jgi:dTDP-4-amino-4,6-dideoxygalactose transaminase
MQAAILWAKLPHLPNWTKARQEAATIYDAGLNQIEDVIIPTVALDRTHVLHLYTIKHSRRPLDYDIGLLDKALEYVERYRPPCSGADSGSRNFAAECPAAAAGVFHQCVDLGRS